MTNIIESIAADTILSEIRAILQHELDIQTNVTTDKKLSEDLGLDSLGAMTVAVHLEDKFQIKLSEEDAPRLVTVGDLITLVQRRMTEKEGG